jgi:hypothetical protein
MPVDILVKYKDFPALEIELIESPIRDLYKSLVKKCMFRKPISRDPQKYTEEYFQQLCTQAQQRLGWNWVRDSYPLSVTTLLHKDIEIFLSQGFHNIPEEFDDLLHELHYALHALQGGRDRGAWIQVEWFNDEGCAIPDDFEFTKSLKFGDVKLQNPYVGHDPAFTFFQKDFSAIEQTCRFHDLVRPGINIMIKGYQIDASDQFVKWYETHASQWVKQHGWKKIMRYTGWPKVGRVLNLDVLAKIVGSDLWDIENVSVVY